MKPRDDLLTPRDDFDRLLAAWFDADAPLRAPEHVAEDAIARSARMRRSPAWLPLGRWPSMITNLRLAWAPRLVWILLLVALALAIGATVYLAAGGRRSLPPPFGLATTGLISYDSNGDIFVDNAGGGGVHPLVATTAFEQDPTWSRDGTRLAYWSRTAKDGPGSLILIDKDGHDPITVVADLELDGPTPVSWSPDGSRLAFSAKGGVYLARTDRAGTTVFGGTVPELLSGGEWSPDGRSLALVSTSSPTGIYVGPVDGSTPPALVTHDALDAYGSPNWSPDGRRIAYFAGAGPGFFDIYVIDADGKNGRDVSNDPRDEYNPSWAPDGNRIGYLRQLVADEPRNQIVIVDPDTGQSSQPKHDPADDGSLDWSPDGKEIAVYVDSAQGQPDKLEIVTADDSVPPAVIPAPGNVGSGGWQRLGQ